MSLLWGTACFRRNSSVGSHPSLAVEGLYLLQENLLPGEDLQQNKRICSYPAWTWLSVDGGCALCPGASKDTDFVLAMTDIGLRSIFFFFI